MKFKSKTGKKVMCSKGIIEFKSEEYETQCDIEIKALSGAIGVEKTEDKPPPKSKRE
ncbi:hypothetical protein NVP1231O_20 [Vibrio phage 1.231.O._10N.261.49.F8]|nr:hypothetical protein NVP1119O_20 [Vibrio phage 1.119.O._10N.261.51.A9]AUR89614.1 hypothetical protein NVP1127O_22 [Vibrio phage 1.127.O._10N.286.52.E12]AUR90392.1 hypothetical protein NVP1143O_20 [Vibrio phage 1.143.O._10N.261.55.C8]AUR96678.1 hypothetical protein NVP1231O_20 [Vibrio phage 1.231.O._10N.261.49.F8]